MGKLDVAVADDDYTLRLSPRFADLIAAKVADRLNTPERVAGGERIRAALLALGLTAREFARRAGCSESALSHALAGRHRMPRAARQALAELGIDPETGKRTPPHPARDKGGVQSKTTTSRGGDGE